MPGRMPAPLCALLPLSSWFLALSSASFDLGELKELPASSSFNTELDEATMQEKGAAARKIVFGIAEAFLNGTRLQHGEAKCLEQSVSNLAGDFVDICSGAVKMMSEVTRKPVTFLTTPAPTTTLPKWMLTSPPPLQATGFSFYQPGTSPAPIAPTSTPRPPSSSALMRQSPGLATGGHLEATFALMEIASKLNAMLQYETRLAKKCLHQDAVNALELAAYHLQNLTYMGNNLGANGADIAAELSYAAVTFDKKDYLGFGIAIGTAARKTLLARNVDMTGEVLSPKAMEEISEGLVQGLFADGIILHMDVELNQAAIVPKGTEVNLATVDVRQCVMGNAEFFRVAWKSAFDVFETISKQASSGAPADFSMNEGLPDELPKLDPSTMMEMSQLVLYMPAALRMCNISHEQEEFLLDALWANGESLEPSVSMHKSQESMEGLVEAATEAWASHDWKQLGERLGQMVRNTALIAFPRKYSIKEVVDQPVSQPLLLPVMAGILGFIVAAVASFRSYRAFHARFRRPSPRSEREALVCTDVEEALE